MGIQTLDTESIFLDWQKFELRIGDSVELRLLEDGEADAPSSIRRSSEAPHNLFSHPELARELLGLLSDFETRLMRFVAKSERSESPEEHAKLRTAVAGILHAIAQAFLYPIYRRHKELIPEDLKGEIL